MSGARCEPRLTDGFGADSIRGRTTGSDLPASRHEACLQSGPGTLVRSRHTNGFAPGGSSPPPDPPTLPAFCAVPYLLLERSPRCQLSTLEYGSASFERLPHGCHLGSSSYHVISTDTT